MTRRGLIALLIAPFLRARKDKEVTIRRVGGPPFRWYVYHQVGTEVHITEADDLGDAFLLVRRLFIQDIA